jgi:hypothetical protein
MEMNPKPFWSLNHFTLPVAEGIDQSFAYGREGRLFLKEADPRRFFPATRRPEKVDQSEVLRVKDNFIMWESQKTSEFSTPCDNL